MPEALPFPAKSQQREKKSCREVTTVLSAKYSALSSTPAKSCAGLGALASRPPNVQLDSGEEDAHLLVARDYADRVPVGGSLDRLIYEVQASDRAEGLYVQGGHEGREVCELEGGRVVEEQRVLQEGQVVPRVCVTDPILGGAGGREIPVYW